MNDLVKQEEKLTLDSREVAEMIEKNHAHLLRDIRQYIRYINQNPKLDSDEFFIKSSYRSGTGKEYKCFEITQKGCEFIANKLTGQKGTQFTATYIEKFHEMKDQLKPNSQLDVLRGALDEIEKAQKEAQEAKQIAQSIKDTIIHTDEDWRNWVNNQLNKIAKQKGNYKQIRRQSYDILENRARCRLGVRLDNLKERLEKAGATQTEINNANKLDVIESDTRLKEIYTSVVEKMAVKYGNTVVQMSVRG